MMASPRGWLGAALGPPWLTTEGFREVVSSYSCGVAANCARSSSSGHSLLCVCVHFVCMLQAHRQLRSEARHNKTWQRWCQKLAPLRLSLPRCMRCTHSTALQRRLRPATRQRSAGRSVLSRSSIIRRHDAADGNLPPSSSAAVAAETAGRRGASGPAGPAARAAPARQERQLPPSRRCRPTRKPSWWCSSSPCRRADTDGRAVTPRPTPWFSPRRPRSRPGAANGGGRGRGGNETRAGVVSACPHFVNWDPPPDLAVDTPPTLSSLSPP